MEDSGTERPTAEIAVVLALCGLAALAVLLTYSRLEPDVLYNVSRGGLPGGLSRTLVLLNFPIALAVIGVVGALLELRAARRTVATLAIALCAVTAWPGVVDEHVLDARLVNAVPALGVLLGVVLAVRARPRLRVAPRRRFDPVRIALAAALVVLAVPWWFAELGFYAPPPVLSDVVPVGEEIAAVHLGHHHGTDGVLLALSALLLSRVAGSKALRAYVSLMLVYGLANAAQDFWLEQVVKRGTVRTELPSILVPEPSLAWALLLCAAALVYALGSREG